MVIEAVRKFLKEPATCHLNANDPEMTIAHRQVLLKKTMLRELFAAFYHQCHSLDRKHLGDTPGKRLEIGSGSSLMKLFYPDVVTSDIKTLPFVDLTLDAQNMDLPDHSLRTIFGINVFHHLPDPRAFFREALRVLHPGGGILLVEPYYGPLARWLFARMHDCEGFDPSARQWENHDQTGPCSDTNQALSYIIFKRDLQTFHQEFPGLRLVDDIPHTQLSYFVSGGVNFRQLAPDWARGLVRGIEGLLAPLNPLIALQHTIVIKKLSPEEGSSSSRLVQAA